MPWVTGTGAAGDEGVVALARGGVEFVQAFILAGYGGFALSDCGGEQGEEGEEEGGG